MDLFRQSWLYGRVTAGDVAFESLGTQCTAPRPAPRELRKVGRGQLCLLVCGFFVSAARALNYINMRVSDCVLDVISNLSTMRFVYGYVI